MGETDMASSAHSPNSVVERYTLSRSNCSIGFEIGNNVVIHMGSHDEDETTRERDSSNVHTKIIMTHNFDVQSLTGRVLTNRYKTVGFRYINAQVGETVTMIDLETKKRNRLKEFGKDRLVPSDIAFAQHCDLFAVLTEDATLRVFKTLDQDLVVMDYLEITGFPNLTNLPNSEKPKICWCPFVPGEDDDDDDDDNQDYITGRSLIAVYGGRYLYIVDVAVLRSQHAPTFTFEHASLYECGVLSLTIENSSDDVDEDVRIVSVCISPDGSAVAVAKSVGPVAFYYIDREISGLKYAHNFDARAGFGGRVNTKFTDLIFLDNTHWFEREEIFWKSCVAVSNGGRQIALYDCQKWKRLGLIRFESPRTVNDFVPIIDPRGDFIHFLDIDGSNVYSVEIYDGVDSRRFVGVTQTSFCHPIYAITHISDSTFENETNEDDIFQNDEDDEEKHDNDDQNDSTEGPSTSNSTTRATTNRKKKPKTKRHFVAMGKKSMQELQITLTKFGTFERMETEVSSPYKNSIVNELTVGIHSPKQEYHFPQYSDSNENEIGGKLDDIVSQLVKIEADRKIANDNVMEMINNLDERMRQRDDYLLNRVEQICENSRLEVISALRDGLGSIESSIERSNTGTSEYVSQRVGSSVRTGLQECVVPAFERTCDALFDRLNDQFRAGLNDYLNATSATIQTAAVAAVQLAQVPVATAAPPTAYDSRAQILQLLKTSPELAFESALNTGDPNLLEFVCSNVNPDTLFAKPNSMSQPVLVSLLQQLTLTLAHERDLKYRYIEHILPAINVSDAETMQHTPNVASQLLSTLQDIIKNTNDEHIRRHTRLLFQLTRSTFYQSPHPTRSLVSDLHTGSQNSPM